MGKRSHFDKKPRDFYPTIDPDAVKPLIPHLGPPQGYIEPCAGAGDLSRLIHEYSGWMDTVSFDIDPPVGFVGKRDALTLCKEDVRNHRYIITNPPFSWPALQPLLDHLPTILPTWLLLPADNMHNKRMAPYMKNCEKVVSVGRLYWEDNKVKGKENYAWYLFLDEPCETIFYGRQE
jgi:hypothetical protein